MPSVNGISLAKKPPRYSFSLISNVSRCDSEVMPKILYPVKYWQYPLNIATMKVTNKAIENFLIISVSSSSKNHIHKEKNKNLKYTKLASKDKRGNSDRSEEIIKKILKAMKNTVYLL